MEDGVSKRVLAFGGAIGGQLYMWGGFLCPDYGVVEVFDPCTDIWRKIATSSPPPPLSTGASAVSSHSLYIYGGFDTTTSKITGCLYQFDSRSETWTRLSLPERGGSPSGKTASGMVVFAGDSKLVLFGGCDCNMPLRQRGAMYEHRATDELHVFDLNDRKWYSPDVTGSRPPPLFGFTLTKINEKQAILFGGKNSSSWNQHLFTLQLDTMKWKKLDDDVMGESSPGTRLFSSAVCLGYGGPSPKLLVVGGLPFTHDDQWLLDIESLRWTKLCLPVSLGLERHGHLAAVFEISPTLSDVVITGGSVQHETPVGAYFPGYKDSLCIAGTNVLIFGGSEQSLQELCSIVIKSALVQQKGLKPSQLAASLPDYVPTRIKQWITRQFTHLFKSSVIHYYVDRDWFYNYTHVCFKARHTFL